MRETPPSIPNLTPREHQAIQAVLDRIAELARFLGHNPVPMDATSADLYSYLARMKNIQGNTDNGVSLVACLMAKEYLNRHLEMAPFDIALKPQGAAGLDIDERTIAGSRVVAEVKTTVPYQPNDLGAQQKAMFKKDFAKLNAAQSPHRFFFVTHPRTFDIMRSKYANEIPGITVVLLPGGQAFVTPDLPPTYEPREP